MTSGVPFSEPFVVPPLYGGIGKYILAVTWVHCGIAWIMVGLRAYAASRTPEGKWRWDFIHICLALFTGTLSGAFVSVATAYGLGNNESNLSVPHIVRMLKWTYFCIFVGPLSMMFGKFAIIALLLEVQRGTYARLRRYMLWAVGILIFVFTVLEVFLTAFQCHPLHKLWDVFEPGVCPGATVSKGMNRAHAGKSTRL